MTSLWPQIIAVTKLYIESPENAPEWLYTGLTILLPKETPNHPSKFRPITSMSNLYKVITKTVTHYLGNYVETVNLLSHIQLGTVKRTL